MPLNNVINTLKKYCLVNPWLGKIYGQTQPLDSNNFEPIIGLKRDKLSQNFDPTMG